MAILFDNDRKAIIEPDKTVSASNFPHEKFFLRLLSLVFQINFSKL